MNSSYLNNTDYGDVLKSITFSINPKTIIEFGLLEGYSLQKFIESSSKNSKIYAFDIFEEFEGNRSERNIEKKFKCYDNVFINYGNFYHKYIDLEDNTIDIIHIDIANNGSIYDFAVKNYLKKITNKGVMILEGGSKERDNVSWMKKYNKPSINKYLENSNLNYEIIGKFPSLTLIKK